GGCSGFSGGGGGRIVVIGSTASFSGSFSAHGGTTGGGNGQNAAAGTIFIQAPSTQGNILIDNLNIATTQYAYLSSAPLDMTNLFDQIILNHKGSLALVNASTLPVTSTNLTGDGTTAY